MVKKFLCWLLGHKIVAKVFTKPNGLIGAFGQVGMFYHYEKQKFCLRCGANSPQESSEGK